MDTVISGGTVVGPRAAWAADVLISGERIAAVEASGRIEVPGGARVIDATGKLVIPGAVDVHTHLDMELGVIRSSDDFTTGTQAAACGGTTTIVDFATAQRGETAAQGLVRWHAKAAGRAVVDYGFHMTITELDRPAADIVEEMAEAGITSFKLYMTYPDRLMVSDDVILEMLHAAGPRGSLISLHCEDDATVARLRAQALAASHTEPSWHAWSRPPEAEGSAVARAARMAEEAGAPCYVVHLSSADGLEQVRLAQQRGLPFYAETCPQYLYLSAERYEGTPEVAARYLCAPPLRDVRHQEELWEGLERGWVRVVATDHCPFTSQDKQAGIAGGGWRDFTQIPGGLPGIETRLSLIYQKVVEGRISPSQWVDWCCSAPARLFGLSPKKGEIAAGSDADVVVFDPDLERPLEPGRLNMHVDYSVYENFVVRGWPEIVMCRGRVVAENGRPVAAPGWGRYIHRGPSGAAP